MTPLSQSTAQFSIAAHYDVMEELDRDVYDNTHLSQSEASTALGLIGKIPRRVFLPCFGTGRHISPLLALGVQRIVGVDLSPKCVEKARRIHEQDKRVQLHVGDLRTWKTSEEFDAVILLGNSFADIIDPQLLLQVTRGMVGPMSHNGVFLMDYIAEGYLGRCDNTITTRWAATMRGRAVHDDRTPMFNPQSRVMSIRVQVTDQDTQQLVWNGEYQKLILSEGELREHFARAGLNLTRLGHARLLNPYYLEHEGELGMIARSTWWMGRPGSS